MYKSIHEDERARRRAARNIIFLILVTFGMIFAYIKLSEIRAERLANEITPSAEAATKVTRQLCVEINIDGYLMGCPD